MNFDIPNRIENAITNNHWTGESHGTHWRSNMPVGIKHLDVTSPFAGKENLVAGDKAYAVIILQNGKQIYSHNFNDQNEFKHFVYKNGKSAPSVNPFIACLIPVRTGSVAKLAKDFFLPTTVNQLHRFKDSNVLSRIILGVGALLLDTITLPVRFFTVWASKSVFKGEEHPTHALLRNENPKEKIDDHVEIHLFAWKVFSLPYNYGKVVREFEIGYQLDFDIHPEGDDGYIEEDHTIGESSPKFLPGTDPSTEIRSRSKLQEDEYL